MQIETQIEIRPLIESDIPAAMRLKELARWNQTESDWRCLLMLEPQGCFAACINDQVIATTTTTTYGTDLAWIGMVLVDPAYRRRGIASRLMNVALDYLRGANVATVKLDATPEGRFVYEGLGFEYELLIERWTGIAPAGSTKNCSVMDAQLRPEVFALDRQAFGTDRSTLLDSLITEACVSPLIVTSANDQLAGYALARRGTTAFYIGPLIATNQEIAVALLDGMLGQLAGEKVYIDFYTGFGKGTQLLAERGLVKQRDLIRMSYGEQSSAGTSPLVCAIAGPEIG